MKITCPPLLRAGDLVAICSPAGAVDNSLFAPAAEGLYRKGYRVEIMSHAMGRQGSYSGSDDERYSDLSRALSDPNVKAVLCARGGYGAVHLLDRLSRLPLAQNPKWLIGFSDISALHALMLSRGIMSAHASMLKGLAAEGGEDVCSEALFSLLSTGQSSLEFAACDASPNVPGMAKGMLAGGNLSVLAGLIGTRYDSLLGGRILFVEDINEPIYKLERVMWQLRLRGVLKNISGMVVGNFTGDHPDSNYSSAQQMIHSMTAEYGYPVAFGAPIGHHGPNMPILHGGFAQLECDSGSAVLRMSGR